MTTKFKHLSYEDRCCIEKELNNNCPFKSMLFICDEWVLNSLNNYYIEPDEVILNKTLLKNKNIYSHTVNIFIGK